MCDIWSAAHAFVKVSVIWLSSWLSLRPKQVGESVADIDDCFHYRHHSSCATARLCMFSIVKMVRSVCCITRLKGYKGYKDGLQPESLADGNKFASK